jgi:hypothetical protein
VILALRDGLRSGDVYVPGSRRYADPATYPYTPAQWKPKQAAYCRLVSKPSRAADALDQGKEKLHTALAEMENALAGALPDDTGTVRLTTVLASRSVSSRTYHSIVHASTS